MKLLLILWLALSAFGLCGITTAQQVVEKIDTIESPETLLEQFGNRSEGLLHEGDRLTFMFRTNAREATLTTMIGAPFQRIGRDGPYLGQVVIPDSDRLLMSYSFAENEENGWKSLRHYRGPNAPEIPISVTPLHGEHLKLELESKHLGETRGVEIYVPKVNTKTPLPVVYLTDGQSLSKYVGALDWKIRAGQLAPLLVVGVHNGGYVGNRDKIQSYEFDHRAKEYLALTEDERYEKHSRFLLEEVMPFVEENYNASDLRKDRALSGFSNGGACVTTISVDHPEVFANVFPYSVAAFSRESLKEAAAGKGDALPNYRFAAGTLEMFLAGTRESFEILKAAGAKAELRTFVAGHDSLMWKVALLEDLQAVFPGEKQK